MPRAFTTWLSRSRTIVAAAWLAASAAASAGVVTINTAGVQQIYDQARIQLRYNPVRTVYDSALLSIDSTTEFIALSNYETGGGALSVFFVDSINYCGAAIPGIVGCGLTPGSLIALSSSYMATRPTAATLMGHEIGHNLGLDHVDPVVPNVSDNLMNPRIFAGNPAPLTPAQIASIFRSPLVQYDGNQAFLSITPFAVSASLEAPEPASIALVSLSLLLLACSRRRRKA